MARPLLVLAALLFAVAALPTAAHAVEPDGSVILNEADGKTYRIVGGAPLRITRCDYVNACKDRKPVKNLAGYRQYPKDSAIVQDLDNKGTYRFAGGAPLWISTCNYQPTCAGRIDVDGGTFDDTAHVRAIPVDGTIIRNVSDGGYYRFAGGAPLLVRCDVGPGCTAPTMVDGQTMAKMGTYTPATPHMRQYPANGAVVVNVDDNAHYRFAGGAPLPVAAPAGAKQIIDSRTLVQNGTATASLPHIQLTPVDGTFLQAGGSFYRVAGGAALLLQNCAVLNGCAGAVQVDGGTIGRLGDGRLRAAPKDGTVVRGLPSNRLWEIISGVRRQTFVNIAGVAIDDAAVELIPTPSSSSPVAPSPSAPFSPVISSGYKVYRRYTRFTSLRVRNAPAGSVVTVACKGRGCPFKKARQYRVGGSGTLNMYSRFRKAHLRSRANVTVRVSGPTGARKQMTFKIRSRKLPVRSTRCAPAGGTFGRC